MEPIVIHHSTRQGRRTVCFLLFLACWFVLWAAYALNGGSPAGYKLFSSLILVPAFKLGGGFAVAAVLCSFALFWVAMALYIWRRTPKLPTDRWWRWRWK